MLKLLGYGFVVFIGVVLIYANMGWDLFLFDWVKYVPFKDKLSHFLLVGTLTFFVNVLLDFKKIKIQKRDFLLGSILVFSFFTIEEMLQGFNPHRNCELLDFLCNTMGVIIFGKMSVYFQQPRRERGWTKRRRF